MTDDLIPRVPAIDPTWVIDHDVAVLTADGIAVAEAIGAQHPFNPACAEMSMRCLAGLVNGFSPNDDNDMKVFGRLPETVQTELDTLAGDSLSLLYGASAQQKVEEELEFFKPSSPTIARLMGLRLAFNGLRLAASIGPDRESGYPASREAKVASMVGRYAHAFANTYHALNAAGHPITAPKQQRYFRGNIEAVRLSTLRQSQQDQPGNL